MPSIVQLNVSEQLAPAPNKLQQTCALVSLGATDLGAGVLQLLTQETDLAGFLAAPALLASVTQTAGLATLTLSTGTWGLPNGTILALTIAGATQTGTNGNYNGTFQCTLVTTTTATFAINSATSSPAVGTLVLTAGGQAQIIEMNNTWWAQGFSVPLYVLELGTGSVTLGATALGNWIEANLQTIYSWIVPRDWDGNSTFLQLIGTFENPQGFTYFFVTTTTGTYNDYTTLMKNVFALVEAPSLPSNEFSIACAARSIAKLQPGSGNRVGPFAFTEVSDVTPYPLRGNSTLLTQLKTANTNYIGTGAEGGISDAIILWGQTRDGNDFEFWYAIDWMQINAKLAVANEIINGSNNPLNPLIYNQQGINRLQDRLYQVIQQSVANGLGNGTPLRTTLDYNDFAVAMDNGDFLGSLVVNAIPLPAYAAANPSDYSTGTYNGLSILFTPSRGFISILINLVAVNFV